MLNKRVAGTTYTCLYILVTASLVGIKPGLATKQPASTQARNPGSPRLPLALAVARRTSLGMPTCFLMRPVLPRRAVCWCAIRHVLAKELHQIASHGHPRALCALVRNQQVGVQMQGLC